MGEDRVLELNDRLEFEIVTKHSAKARIYIKWCWYQEERLTILYSITDGEWPTREG